jgi:vancomycin permeability regulator SanA
MIGLGAVIAASVVSGTNAWVRAAASGLAYASAAEVPARSVAIVPGAVVRDGRPAGSLTQRLQTALDLYREHRVKAILISGNETADSPEVGAMRAWLRERAVPARDIWSDPRGSRTRETMLNAAGAFDVADAVICTQAAYAERALFLARQAGIDAVAVDLAPAAARSLRAQGLEAFKTTAAVFESVLRRGPSRGPTIVASR